MNFLSLILRKKRPSQPSETTTKILIKTDNKGKVKVYNARTGELLTNIGRISLYVNRGKVCAEIEFKDVELDFGIDYVITKKTENRIK